MDKYLYWSETNQKFIRIYAVVDSFQVELFYEDLEPFKPMQRFEWNIALNQGKIVKGWTEEGE